MTKDVAMLKLAPDHYARLPGNAADFWMQRHAQSPAVAVSTVALQDKAADAVARALRTELAQPAGEPVRLQRMLDSYAASTGIDRGKATAHALQTYIAIFWSVAAAGADTLAV